MAVFRSCSRSTPSHLRVVGDAHPPLRELTADGPLHPELPPIDTPLDAFDAIDLLRPNADFSSWIVLLLDVLLCPLVAVAVRARRHDDLGVVSRLLADAVHEGRPIDSIVLGVVRGPHDAVVAGRVTDEELVAWRSFSGELGDAGVELLDVLVVEPDAWFSFASISGHLGYR